MPNQKTIQGTWHLVASSSLARRHQQLEHVAFSSLRCVSVIRRRIITTQTSSWTFLSTTPVDQLFHRCPGCMVVNIRWLFHTWSQVLRLQTTHFCDSKIVSQKLDDTVSPYKQNGARQVRCLDADNAQCCLLRNAWINSILPQSHSYHQHALQ